MTLSYAKDVPRHLLSVKVLWEAYQKTCLRPGMPDYQKEAIRIAFASGFLEAFKIFVDISSELTEAEAVGVLDRVHKEAAEHYTFMKEKYGA